MKGKLTVSGIIAAIVLITIVSASSSEPLTAYVAQFGVFVNGEEKVFENPIVTIDNRTYIPLREIGEILGIDVEWDGENRRIIINSPQVLYELEQDTNKDEWDKLYAFEQDGLWGYKDVSGNLIIEPRFAAVRSFSEGLAWVGGNNAEERGYIDLSGNLVIPLPEAYVTGDFSQGFARVVMREWDFDNESLDFYICRSNGGLQGPLIFINRAGENVFGMEFLGASDFQENGLAEVQMLDGNRARIDREGNIVNIGN
ncbi:MAG: WG repeat-containing protein [Defluviitaleaceae bacterium]|nr:WG repeat-containing protein [Defluviitaleaceae bacterium]